MAKVLIVEDSRTLSRHLAHRLSAELGLASDTAATLADAEIRLRDHRDDYELALLDLTLPDAEALEVVDLANAHRVPSIVFTGDYSDELREQVLARNVIDYVVKDGASELAHVVELVRRFRRNASTRVLVVDDSTASRHYLAELLRLHNYRVVEAADGPAALAALEKHPDVKLVLTDYVMPGMDGCELISRIRHDRPRETLAVIGLSAQGSGTLSARFLKRGANDFLSKPFLAEEFYCRVRQNVELLESLAEIRDLTYRDPLTGLWNRRWFFERGPRELAAAEEDGWPVTLAMIDVDHFKRVNDGHGHEAGDLALVHVASLLRAQAGDDLVARLGGEEFCVLSRLSGERAERHFEALRATVAATPARAGGLDLPLTLSIGLAQGRGPLDDLLREADGALYEAKRAGRDRVVRSSGPTARAG